MSFRDTSRAQGVTTLTVIFWPRARNWIRKCVMQPLSQKPNHLERYSYLPLQGTDEKLFRRVLIEIGNCAAAWAAAVTEAAKILYALMKRWCLTIAIIGGSPVGALGNDWGMGASNSKILPSSIFNPVSTPAHEINTVAFFVVLDHGGDFPDRRRPAGLQHRAVSPASRRRRPRTAAGVRQQSHRVRLDDGARPHCIGTHPRHGSYHLYGAGGGTATRRAQRTCDRASMVVGVPLPRPRHRHR